MHATDRRRRDQPGEHLLQRVARPHRALAVVAVIEQLGPRRPGEDHGLAAKANAVGEVGSIERRGLERLVEPVHVEQDVARRALPHEVGHRPHGLDRAEPPIVEPHRCQREAAVVGRHEPRARKSGAPGTLGAEPWALARAVDGLARGRNEQCRIGR